jgi:hypothetical protein
MNVRAFAAARRIAAAAAVTCATVLAPAAAMASPGTQALAAVARAGGWRPAIEVPGLASLSEGFGGGVQSVSCASVGNCVAGGFYELPTDQAQAFVVTETNGKWGKAIKIHGAGALTAGGRLPAVITSVSCASPGNCAAGGWDGGRFLLPLGFVVSEQNGRWGTARQEPGPGVLGSDDSFVNSVSCASAGNCVAGGQYVQGSAPFQAFVVSESNGIWHRAIAVPGTRALEQGNGFADVSSVSCTSLGSCAAGGFYQDIHGHGHAFVTSESNETWHKAIEVPGLAALNKGGNATVTWVSCALAGNCAAVGYYKDGHGHQQAFVVSKTNGTWARAIEVPGLAALNKGGNAVVTSVSCRSAGSCAAGGQYADARRHEQAFVVSETGGTWGTARQVPGSAALNTGGGAIVDSMSCASVGNCAAGGFYRDGHGHQQAMVVSETDGTWGRAIEVPGSAALNTGGSAAVTSVSCASARTCSAGGYYIDAHVREQAFVV